MRLPLQPGPLTYVALDPAGYERGMGRWSRRLAEVFLDQIAMPQEGAVLDAGCGTGALSAALIARRPALHITGIDPSPAYVAAAQAALPLARFRTGDIQALELADASQDAALALLVLQFVPDRAAAVAELARVVRPGGFVATAMWDFWGGFPFIRMFADIAAATLPAAEAWRARHWGDTVGTPGRLGALFTAAGLREVTEHDITIRQDLACFDDWYRPWLAGEGFIGAFLVSLSAADRTRLEAALRRAWGDPDGRRSFTATARMATGWR